MQNGSNLIPKDFLAISLLIGDDPPNFFILLELDIEERNLVYAYVDISAFKIETYISPNYMVKN